jgi:hypothetical protein
MKLPDWMDMGEKVPVFRFVLLPLGCVSEES